VALATTCTACGTHENGIQGALNLGTSIGASLTEKVLGTDKSLGSLTFAVGPRISISPDY